MSEQTALEIQYERGYLKGYEEGLLAPQSQWMKARREELAQAFDAGALAMSRVRRGGSEPVNPYRGRPGGES